MFSDVRLCFVSSSVLVAVHHLEFYNFFVFFSKNTKDNESERN